MLKEQAKLLTRIAVVLDGGFIVGAFALAYHLRLGAGPVQPVSRYLWLVALAVPVWIYFLSRQSLYASIRRLHTTDVCAKVFGASFMSAVTLGGIIYLVDKHFSRGLFLTFLVLAFVGICLEKTVLRKLLGLLRKKGFNTRNVLIVGTREKAERFHQLLEQHADWGIRVVGFLQAVDGPLLPELDGHQVLGRLEDLAQVCKDYPVDEVVFCLPKDLVVDAEEHLLGLEELGVTVRMVLDFYDLQRAKRELAFFHGELPILTFYTRSLDAQQLFFKRVLDLLGALVGLTLLALMLPVIAFAIKRDSPGPIFFGQERVGENGRIFKCWKFRSMYQDAEERKQELMDQNEMSGAIFKIKDDPRITPVGRLLRKTSLDEFPQFWNVLKGEMSLVGTRPPTPAEVAEYENWHRRRITIKPGITGMWQVNGRNQIEDFDEIARLDLNYIDNWSLWLDVKLLLRTVLVVFAREGSY